MNQYLLGHIIFGSFVLILGLLIILKKENKLVRKSLIIASLMSAFLGALMIPSITEGVLARIGFSILLILWLFFIFNLSKDKNFNRKNPQFIRAYAISLTAITRQIWMFLFKLLGFSDNISYTLGLYLGFGLNLIIAEYLIRRKNK